MEVAGASPGLLHGETRLGRGLQHIRLPDLHPYRLRVALLVRHPLLLELGLLLLLPLPSLGELPRFLSGEHDGIVFLLKEEQGPVPDLHRSLGQWGNGFPDLHFGYSALVEGHAVVCRL